ncbi:hypothetical protein A2Y99_05045 [Candidatus Gottesmanbacteria bacterium RBG_13_37_7]|uniref:DUF192 domain-containing protein n=1 Tax=Candidatus Gottesmanbacteria bacterium RBG_13_37_7 TaxID=1798369 RepID=A0A1F5YGJ8_9BACT|nr:MAG: hypothetical protein A2Y99_05045 [Candidatus Gottesmanbacteria bacterium RBG_13_37_7]
MKNWLFRKQNQIFILLIIILCSCLFIFIVNKNNSDNYVLINNHKILVELADTDKLREKGLSGRSNLPENRGMLFIFPQERIYSFWMKEMLIPLDIIWIKNNKIVDYHQNVPFPEPGITNDKLKTYSPKEPVDKVLEVNAGTIEKIKINTGDNITVKGYN